MEHGACNLIYVDQKAKDRTVRRNSTVSIDAQQSGAAATTIQDYFKQNDNKQQQQDLQTTIDSLCSIFATVHVFSSGTACLAKITELESGSNDSIPTLVLIDIPYDEEAKSKRWSREARTPSPTFSRSFGRVATTESLADPSDINGMRLLSHISSEIQFKRLSKLIIPIAVVSGFERDWAPVNVPSPSVHGSHLMSDSIRLSRFIDAGAVDVLTSPLTKPNVQSLAMHAYRTYREVSKADSTFMASKRNRKLSWVGVEDEKPYAYLREAMVSNLMSGICSPENESDVVVVTSSDNPLAIDPSRREFVAKAVGSWAFSAHELSDDELLYAALTMLEHTLSVSELDRWKISTVKLVPFLEACQNAYNSFVHYHNFRHAVDVMQAVFFFLLQLQVLPTFKFGPESASKSPVASLLNPFDALTLLISAIGHDVGHPGVNNAFLVSLNAPLAQLYNDRSVLESFHCAAYSQILRRHWPAVFEDTAMRKMMINIILATDMGLHFKYMNDLKSLQGKVEADQSAISTWETKDKDETRDLVCGLLIKCADISNVARIFDSARQWADILTEEFANQGAMETELGIPTCLFGGPPVPGDMVKMAESQQGFINIFAGPLFQNVTKVLPSMSFSIDEMDRNKEIWALKKAAATSRHPSESESIRKDSHNDTIATAANLAGVGSSASERPQKSLSDPEIFKGKLEIGHITTTSTALPLMQQLASESSPAVLNGTIAPPKQKLPRQSTKSLRLFSKSSSSSTPTNRTVSAHQHRINSSSKEVSLQQINGYSSSHTASESDTRMKSNGGTRKKDGRDSKVAQPTHHKQQDDDDKDSSTYRKNKKLTQSFRRLWKKTWQSRSNQDLRTSHEEASDSMHSRSVVSPTTTTASGEADKVESSRT